MGLPRLEIIFQVIAIVSFPFLLGLKVSPKIIPQDLYKNLLVNNDIEFDVKINKHERTGAVNSASSEDNKFDVLFNKIIGIKDGENDPLMNITLAIHRNGEPKPCELSVSSVSRGIRAVAFGMGHPLDKYDKYHFDSVLTEALANDIIADENCGYEDSPYFLDFCDMGEDHTVIQLDHHKLQPIKVDDESESLPCHFHTREGVRVSSLEQLASMSRKAIESSKVEVVCTVGSDGQQVCTKDSQPQLHLYAVPAGRVFMFAPSYVGETFNIPHVKTPSGEPISLKVISISPKVFDVINFFSKDESDAIVEKAVSETSETHKMKRSSTGASGYNINNRRTSENAFDTHSKKAMTLKKRCFEVLGFDEYEESLADGLQVIRYNTSTAYVDHMDWIDDPSGREEHNYYSDGVGTNRFATILLYMSDLPENAGGETVFIEGWPLGQPEENHLEIKEAIDVARKSGETEMFDEGSWQEKMVAQCQSRLSIKPAHAKAVLFYSQHPNGFPDESSRHGGCPVLKGTKWAANLWVWNGPRGGYEGSPVNQDVVDRKRKNNKKADTNAHAQLHATFVNNKKDPRYAKAELYFQETFWGKFGHGDPILAVNTFEGHQWNVMVDGEVVKQFIINKEPRQQYSI
mmetsp:Transcript_37871/g.55790  ORF Transcript_37871/g.55790 Transcript_37871/m.55790 type:complete len:631 (+) Transcript_37871:71-1963(+)|eukprot:CAMPEP_0195520302 /NCGR_PEP_ID=MMETSP0794_2-20130614/16587_1 /TAXON_ID=515487 /ORGANISM="Stephanopyxis turris, Strain CCMP 815" /LENGTH=630 /DNA_ID=CAMNT_0040649633 /DNA_START=69 /DNA_END=1961 /DNA_ORIENTATION=+